MRLTFKRVVGLLALVSPVRMKVLRRVEHEERNQNTQVKVLVKKDEIRLHFTHHYEGKHR